MVWGTQNATDYHKWQRAWPRDVLGGYYLQMGDVVEDAMGGLIFHTSNCEFAACN